MAVLAAVVAAASAYGRRCWRERGLDGSGRRLEPATARGFAGRHRARPHRESGGAANRRWPRRHRSRRRCTGTAAQHEGRRSCGLLTVRSVDRLYGLGRPRSQRTTSAASRTTTVSGATDRPHPQLSRLGVRDTQMGCFARAAERACSRSARARARRLGRVVERGEALPREVGQTLGTAHGFSRSPGRPERPSPANSRARRTRPPSVTAGDQAPRSSIRRRLLVSGDRDGIGADLGRFSA